MADAGDHPGIPDLPALPLRLARVVPAEFAETPTLSAPGTPDAFVTTPEDLTGIGNAREVAQRLTLLDSGGTLQEGAKAIIEFDTPSAGLASPVFRNISGFVGRGRTAGGAREFTLPNLEILELRNVRIRIVP